MTTDREQIISLALRCGFAVEPHAGQVFVTDGANEVQCTLGLEAFYRAALEAKERENAELHETIQALSIGLDETIAERDSLAEQLAVERECIAGYRKGAEEGLALNLKLAEQVKVLREALQIAADTNSELCDMCKVAIEATGDGND